MTPIDHFESRKLEGMSIHAEILLHLIKHNEGNVMPIIKKAVGMEIATPNTIHREITWLKNHGFVEVLPRPEDKRAKICSITQKGVAFLNQV
jgi:DNA-binding MarR family transcriptional regulator